MKSRLFLLSSIYQFVIIWFIFILNLPHLVYCQSIADFRFHTVFNGLYYENDDMDVNLPENLGRMLARDAYNNIHIVFTNLIISPHDTSLALYYTRFNSENPDNQFGPIRLDRAYFPDSQYSVFPTIDVDENNRIHLIWVQIRSSLLTHLVYIQGTINPDNYQVTWSDEKSILFTCLLPPNPNQLCIDSPRFIVENGLNAEILHGVYITSTSLSTVANIQYFRYNFVTDTLLNDEPISGLHSFALMPGIALDADNQPHVVWTDNSNDNLEVFYRAAKTQDNDVLWIDPTINLSQSSKISFYPDIVVDFNNMIHVLWTELDGAQTNMVLHYRRKSISDSSFQPPEYLTNPAYDFPMRGQLAASNNGDLYLTWQGSTIQHPMNGTVYLSAIHFSHYLSGSGWIFPEDQILTVEDTLAYHMNLITRKDARESFDFLWFRTYLSSEDPFSTSIEYGNYSFNDSPNTPSQIELIIPDPVESDIPTTDPERNFAQISWYYSDPEDNPQQLFLIEVSADPQFTQPVFYFPNSAYSPSDEYFTYTFVDSVFNGENILSQLDDGVYFFRIRVGDTLYFDEFNQIVINWSPWSKENTSFRLDKSPPDQVSFTIGNYELRTQNATVTYDTKVVLYLSAVDSVDYSIRIWGIQDHPTYASALLIPTAQGNTTFVEVDLLSGDGIKHIYAEFEDLLGHKTTVSDSIILDQLHMMYPNRDNVLIIPEVRDDGIPDNDSRLIIPAGAITDTIQIIPFTTFPLKEGGLFVEQSELPSGGDHPLIDSKLVEAIGFKVNDVKTHTELFNIKFNTPNVSLNIHFDNTMLYEGEVDLDELNSLKIFFWDGVNWVLLDSEFQTELKQIQLYNMTYLPSTSAHNSMVSARLDFGLFKIKGGYTAPLSNLIVRPNPFTPNMDGVNDLVYFYFDHTPFDDIAKIQIFDERGKKIREIKERFSPIVWDGKDDYQKDLEGGLYFYQIEQGTKMKQGSLVLIR